MIRIRIIALLVALGALVASPVAAKVRIASATTDLASIAQMIGGDHVDVDVICRGSNDPHFVQILPSYMLKVSRADIYLRVGMDLDFWSNQIIDGSGNGKLLVVDCSKGINRLEVPTTNVDASMGDIHIQGNPHYWLDPANGVSIAEQITEALIRVDPGNNAAYSAALDAFRNNLEERIDKWQREALKLNGAEIVMYHNSWPYFARAFGIQVAGFVEPKPGIEPTPSHTAQLIDLIKARHIKVIGREPYFSDRAPKTIAAQTGAYVVVLPTSVGGVKEATDYFALFDTLIARLQSSLEGS
jgi:zinc/manganese transport system substrate-binding protein